MTLSLPRLLYLLTAVAWALLLWPQPITIFMAACLSCLTLPQYRALQKKARCWRFGLARRLPPSRHRDFLQGVAGIVPLGGYLLMLLSCMAIPIAILVLLVSPQAAAGFARLRELQANNFQLPPEWVANIQLWRDQIAAYPRLDKMLNDFLHKLESLLGDTVSILLTRSMDFLGGTMTVLWTALLFFSLTVLFTLYSRTIRKVARRILRIPGDMLQRFTHAIHKALRGVMLGIVLVALAQGILCGIAFAVAGIRQPAFWGMLVAHIGVGVFIIGVAGVNTLETEADEALAPGQSMSLGGYEFRLQELREVPGPNYQAVQAKVEVSRDGRFHSMLLPEKRAYSGAMGTTQTEAAIETRLTGDVYVALGERLPDGRWTMLVWIKPFVDWIWGGCVLMALGGFIAMADRRYRRQRAHGRRD